jgi:L-fuculose-phosphate aldolase
VSGIVKPGSELDLHLGAYARYGAGAVIHTHSPMVPALSCVLDELLCIHYQMLLLGGASRAVPHVWITGAAGVTLEALAGRVAALMANHGAIVIAGDLSQAIAQTELLEWACTLYWPASAVGQPRALSEAQQADVVAAATRLAYGTSFSAALARAARMPPARCLAALGRRGRPSRPWRKRSTGASRRS